ncbi:MAG: response regulator [Nitrospirae bacterium]|nr:response regulator [Nitrospirota bacterium]
MPAQVLVVDHNPLVQTTIENALHPQKLEVTSVRDALSGLDLAYKIRPDLIIADLRMEGLMIYSFCARIRQKPYLANIPIFLLVQQNDTFDEGKLRQSGVVGYIQKPVDPDKLNEILSPYLARFSSPASDYPLTPSRESASVNLIEEMKETPVSSGFTLDLDNPETMDDVDERTFVEQASIPPASLEETVKIEDILGWSQDEVSPFSEVISSPSSEETQMTGLTRMMEESPLPDATFVSSPSGTIFDPGNTTLDTVNPLPLPAVPETSEEIASQNGKPAPSENVAVSVPDSLPVFGSVADKSFRASDPQVGPADVSLAARDMIEKVVWEVVPHLAEQALKKEALAAMIEKVLWEVVPHIAEQSVKEAIRKITENTE